MNTTLKPITVSMDYVKIRFKHLSAKTKRSFWIIHIIKSIAFNNWVHIEMTVGNSDLTGNTLCLLNIF